MSAHRWRASENYVGATFYPLLLGPLALVSYSWIGFIVMGIAWLMSFVLLFVGIGLVLLPLVHIICSIWAIATVPGNRRRREEKTAG